MLFLANARPRQAALLAGLLLLVTACSPASTGRELDVQGGAQPAGVATTLDAQVTRVIPLAESGDGGFAIESPAFGPGDDLPEASTVSGQQLSPALDFLSVPAEAVELALVVTDVDNADFVHWLVSGIAPSAAAFAEGAASPEAIEHFNGAGEFGWFAPSKTVGTVHRYRFQLYALSSALDLEAEHDIPATIDTIERQAISRSSILAVLVG
ncbi:MAG: hypothetical protein V3V01_00585 [Acidimicrobiales bacterium]